MSRITKLPLCCQWAGALAAVLLLGGCACGAAPLPIPLPGGAAVSRSGFDGGSFLAVLPVRTQAGDPGPIAVLEQVVSVLKEMGFVRSLVQLVAPAQPIRLEPPDIGSLAAEVCRDPALQESRGSRELCAALAGTGQPSPAAEDAIRNAYGVSFGEWKEGLTRLSSQIPFVQAVAGVPIEGAGLFIFRRQGESPALVYGSLFDRYTIVNRADPRLLEALLRSALLLLGRQMGDGLALLSRGEATLVLVPDGTVGSPAGEAVPALRFAWRLLVGRERGPGSWMAWIDATSGKLLRVSDQGGDATDVVRGVRWRRDPGLCTQASPPCTEPVLFEVDRKGGKLALQLNGVFQQIETAGRPSLEVEPGKAGFDRSPIQRADTAVCAAQDNNAFRQVNAYSHLYSLWKIVTSVGTVPKFPEKPLRIVVDDADPGDQKGSAAYYDNKAGDALSSLWLADGQGFRDAKCPATPGFRLNGAQDATVLAHEFFHLVVQRIQERRPAKWCCTACLACPLPDVLGHNILHDLADGLAFSYASTNCFAGWSAKNLDGPDANLYCKGKTSEAGGFPRLASLNADRFPDHRLLDKGEYANGQIAAAALWEIRQGMRSKAQAAGGVEYWVRLLRALGGFGFLTHTCSNAVYDKATQRYRYTSCDRDVFLYLQDLEQKMVGEWAVGGATARQTVNKVLSGWARAGLFLVPFPCLDGDPKTTDPKGCPGQDTALDAVIEIDDQEPADDLKVDGIVHREVDYLRKGGPAPRFEVWTGPRYQFLADGTISKTAPALCGNRFEVQLASEPLFKTVAWASGQQPVDAAEPCWGQVALTATDWKKVQTLVGPKVYYRVRTWDKSGRERLSTAGVGDFKLDPPFAVINDSGRP